jgi:uncharacterized protein
VALLNRADEHHGWAVGVVPTLRGPWLTAEACISEAVFLLERAGRLSVEALFRWLEQGALVSRHCLPEELAPLRSEMFRYGGRWVDFADACLVTLSDTQPKLPVVSVDTADFSSYFRRRSARKLILPTQRR